MSTVNDKSRSGFMKISSLSSCSNADFEHRRDGSEEEKGTKMVPPPNAEGVEGVEAVLTVTGLTDDQIERFIEYESITSIASSRLTRTMRR